MNVLLVTPYFPPQTGGVVTFVDTLQRFLRKKGHRAYVLVPGPSHTITPYETPTDASASAYELYLRTPWAPEAPLKSCLAFSVYFLPTLLQLRWFIQKKAIDLISLEYPLSYMYYFYLLKKMMGVKLIVGIHGSDVLSLPSTPRYEQWLVKKIIRGADFLLAHSSSLMLQAEVIIKGLNSNRSYIPYGIEPDQLHTLVRKESGKLSLPPKPYILTVAKLHERKGLDVLLHAIQMVGTARRDYSFVIVGNGPEEQALRQLAVTLGIQDAVVFTGELQRDDIAKLYQGCEFFVLPSRSEPFGIVLLEAMVFGKAIVATTVGGIPEFVTDGFNGILVSPDNPGALAESIAHLIKDPELKFKIGRNGPALVEKQYDFQVIADRYEKLFQQVISPEMAPSS